MGTLTYAPDIATRIGQILKFRERHGLTKNISVLNILIFAKFDTFKELIHHQ